MVYSKYSDGSRIQFNFIYIVFYNSFPEPDPEASKQARKSG